MPEQPPTLRDMIKEAIADGTTYEQLANRARERFPGSRLSGSHLNNIALGNVSRMPTPDRLRAIAGALNVPYERVRQAAITQWVPPDESAGAHDPEVERQQIIDELTELRDRTTEALGRLESEDHGAAG